MDPTSFDHDVDMASPFPVARVQPHPRKPLSPTSNRQNVSSKSNPPQGADIFTDLVQAPLIEQLSALEVTSSEKHTTLPEEIPALQPLPCVSLFLGLKESRIKRARKVREWEAKKLAYKAQIAIRKAQREQREAEEAQRKEAEQREAEEAKAARLKAEDEEEAKRQQEEENAKRRTRRRPIEPIIRPLDEIWEKKMQKAFAEPMETRVAYTSKRNPITRRDVGRILPQRGTLDDPSGWLNDEIITAYLQAIVDYGHQQQLSRSLERGENPLYHAFNPFFWTNLKQSVEKVQRWAGKAHMGGFKLLKVENVFIPCNMGGNHWTLLVVSPKLRTIEYFDSLHGSAKSPIAKTKEWLQRELGKEYRADEWTVVEDPHYIGRGKGPTQNNGSDCGVFTLATARNISLGVDELSVCSDDMPLMRKRIVAEILNGGFLGGLEPVVVFE
ncbi:hypothetical protein MMC21_003558 [Puttea exsequens]|nr:hypothetical protein [Puttea exsequens]